MGDSEEPIEDIESTAEEEEELEAGAAKRKLFGPSLVRTLLYVAAALVMLVISGTVAYVIARRVGVQPGQERISSEFTERKKPLAQYDLGEFSLNTSDPVEPHFIKITMVLGYEEGNQLLQTEIVARRPQLRDIVINIVGAKTFSELATQDMRKELKDELLDSINSILKDGQIEEIFFTEFVLT